MKYMTASQAAEKWKISQRRVQILCAQNRIKGVFKLGENWAIPMNTPKPSDKRRKAESHDEEILELICGKMPQLLISIIFPMRLC